ncbi:MAG: hypothetical protein AAB408_00815 [Patescibacteria group bacterium]
MNLGYRAELASTIEDATFTIAAHRVPGTYITVARGSDLPARRSFSVGGSPRS